MGNSPSFFAISSSCVGRNMRTAMSDSRSSKFSTESDGTSSMAMAGNSRLKSRSSGGRM
jgi:hypothetical protein